MAFLQVPDKPGKKFIAVPEMGAEGFLRYTQRLIMARVRLTRHFYGCLGLLFDSDFKKKFITLE